MIAVQDILYELKKELGAFFSLEAHPASDLLGYITSGARLLSTKRPWEFNVIRTQVTLANGFDLAAVRETSETLAVSTISNPKVRLIKKAEFLATTDTSYEYATLYDTTFSASQAGTYTIIHRAYPDTVTDENGTIDMPASMRDMLVNYSLYFGYLSAKQTENAVDRFNVAEGLLPFISARNTDTTPNEPTVM